MKKRILSVLIMVVMLTVTMIVMLPTAAFAADGDVASVSFDGATTYFATFDEAWEAVISCATTADKKATLTLLDNCSVSATLTNAEDYIVFDTNGKLLTCLNGYSCIKNCGGVLEIIGTGGITKTKGAGNSYLEATVCVNGGKTILDGPEISCSGTEVARIAVVVITGEFHFLSGTILSNERAFYSEPNCDVYLYSGKIASSGSQCSVFNRSDVTICYSDSPLILSNLCNKVFQNYDYVKLDSDVESLTLKYGNYDESLTTDTGKTSLTNEYNTKRNMEIYTVKKQVVEVQIAATPNLAEGGTVSGGGTYNEGESVMLTATANTGYTFVNWTDGDTVVGTDATLELVADANRNLVANFELESYAITAAPNLTEGGTVSGEGTYSYGATVTLTAAANDGYAFVNWTDGDTVVGTDATLELVADANRSLVANFELTVFDLTVVYGVGGVSNKTVKVDKGTTLSLETPEIEGYTFLGWYYEADFGSKVDFTKPITESLAVYARFTATMVKIEKTATEGTMITYTITYSDETTSTFTVNTESDNGGIYEASGKDGIAPKLRINSESKEWEISYDDGDSWTSLGFEATGDDENEDNDENGDDVNGDNGETGDGETDDDATDDDTTDGGATDDDATDDDTTDGGATDDDATDGGATDGGDDNGSFSILIIILIVIAVVVILVVVFKGRLF